MKLRKDLLVVVCETFNRQVVIEKEKFLIDRFLSTGCLPSTMTAWSVRRSLVVLWKISLISLTQDLTTFPMPPPARPRWEFGRLKSWLIRSLGSGGESFEGDAAFPCVWWPGLCPEALTIWELERNHNLMSGLKYYQPFSGDSIAEREPNMERLRATEAWSLPRQWEASGPYTGKSKIEVLFWFWIICWFIMNSNSVFFQSSTVGYLTMNKSALPSVPPPIDDNQDNSEGLLG